MVVNVLCYVFNVVLTVLMSFMYVNGVVYGLVQVFLLRLTWLCKDDYVLNDI